MIAYVLEFQYSNPQKESTRYKRVQSYLKQWQMIVHQLSIYYIYINNIIYYDDVVVGESIIYIYIYIINIYIYAIGQAGGGSMLRCPLPGLFSGGGVWGLKGWGWNTNNDGDSIAKYI